MNPEKTSRWFVATLAMAVTLAGAAAMTLEIAGAHTLAPGFGTGLNAWSAMITVALGGLGCGYALGGFVADRWSGRAAQILSAALALSGAACVGDAFVWYGAVCHLAGLGMRLGAVLAAAALFFLPFVLLGAVYPLAVRLWTRDVNEVGRRSGLVSALSAAGSVAGAATAGFVLVPGLSLEAVFGCAAAVLFVAAAMVLAFGGGARIGVLVLFVGAAFAPGLPARPLGEGMLWRSSSPQGFVEVVDRDDIRYLLISGTVQGMATRDELRPLFPYVRMIAGALQENLTSEAGILLLGLGAGLLPRALPPGMCESVEIDPSVAEAARRFFACDPEHYPVHIADGRAFLMTSARRYGAVVIDAYGGWNYPYHLLTRECFDLARRRLVPGGFLVVNFQGYLRGSEDRLLRSVERTLRSVFEEVEICAWLERDDSGNAVLVAHGRDARFDWPGDRHPCFETVSTFLDARPTPVLTDSRNPTELWSAVTEQHVRRSSFGRGPR
ncbi:MAG: fused MFS/spermidine synthase [Planctomycetota bacterium]